MENVLLWFRNDLRLHDNIILQKASEYKKAVPVFVFDPRWFGTTSFGFPHTGGRRFRFLRETVENLRSNLRKWGSELITRTGNTEDELGRLVERENIDRILAQKESASEELEIERAVSSKVNAQLDWFWGSRFSTLMIFHMPRQYSKGIHQFSKINGEEKSCSGMLSRT